MKQFIGSLAVFLWGAFGGIAGTSSLTTSGDWANASSWSPVGQPGSSTDVRIQNAKNAMVYSDVGTIQSLTIGDATTEGAINLESSSAVLRILKSGLDSVVVGGPAAAFSPYSGTGSQPGFYSHSAGSVSTTGNFIAGTNGLSAQAFFTSGTLAIGGTLRLGVQTNGLSSFTLRGAGGVGSSISASALQVGSRGQLAFDFLGGSANQILKITNSVTINSGASLVIQNAGSVTPGTYLLIDGGSVTGTFTNVTFQGFSGLAFPSITYDPANGDVLLEVAGFDNEFDNYGGDYFWSNPDNWIQGSPQSSQKLLVGNTLILDTVQEAAYIVVGGSFGNGAFNLYPGGQLNLTRPTISMIVGGGDNGAGAPNYYSHAAGTLSTVGDFVLGANGGKASAQFSSGSMQIGGTLRLGSYQAAGDSTLELRGGGGTIGVQNLEIGANGKLVFDFLTGNGLKTLTVTNQTTLLSGSKLSFTVGNPAAITPATYSLIKGSQLTGTFSQVDLSAFPTNVSARIVYTGGWVNLEITSASSANPTPDPAVSRLSGFSRVVPLSSAGYSYGVAADGEAFYFSDYNQGTINYSSNGITRVVYSNQVGIYGLAKQGNKLYFGREGTNAATTQILELTGSGTNWGSLRVITNGISRPRQLFTESSGTLLLAAETAGSILRINPTNGAVTTLITNLTAPQAAVSDSAGNLYFNEYGSTSSNGTPVASGKLWKRPAGTTNRIQLLDAYRMRGLALVAGTTNLLAQLTEANSNDQGNSATLTILTTDGTVVSQVQGVDYPQFTTVTSSGAVVTTSPRDKAALSFLPQNTAGSDTAFSVRTGVDVVATVRGSASRTNGAGSYAVNLTGLAGGTTALYVTPDTNRRFAGWIRMNRSEWPSVSTNEYTYPNPSTQTYTPGVFALPALGVQTSGTLDRVQVMAHRSRNVSRWPMTNVGKTNEAPQTGFSEVPDGYLAYVEISQLAPTVSWDGGAGDGLWSTAANWSGDVLPGSGDNVLLNAGANVTSATGAVGNVVVGNADGNGSLNMVSPGSLTAKSLTIGAANNAPGYPNYFYGNGGAITTSNDLVIGANGAKIDGTYTWGDINVGGALKIGSGYTNTNSTLVLRGATGAINSGSLVVGAGVQLVFDFIGGTPMRTLNVTNGVTLEAGSRLKIVGNSNLVAGSNPRLINGGAGQLIGTFSTVTFEGFPANVVPRIEYNATDGDVWLVLAARNITWSGGGGANRAWSNSVNWTGGVVPGVGDDALVNGSADVTGSSGPVGNVIVGNADGNGSLNMVSPGSLAAKSLTIGATNNAGGGAGFPNYFVGNGGNLNVTNDFVLGANGAKIDGSFTWGNVSVGGALRIGSGYSATNSTLVLRGATGAINSGSLVVGPGVQLVFDFIGGNSMRTLTAAGPVTLESGSKMKIVGNTNVGAGNNVRLINGASNQMTGTFTTVTFEGFSANVTPRIEYNSTDGDVWLVVDAAATPTTPFSSWFGSTNAPDSVAVGTYAIGGASGPSAQGEKPASSMDGTKLYLTAIIRTNDTNLSVVGQSVTSLTGTWSNLLVNPQGVASTNTNNVPSGCQRRVFSVDRGTNARQFLRIKATLN